MAIKPIPDGYHTITPYLACHDAAAAIEFYTTALGFTELCRMGQPNGKVGHAELQLGDSRVMLADEYPDMGWLSPKTIGNSPVTMHVYVENVDALVDRAVKTGAKLVRPVKTEFYGDRSGTIEDPFGHKWHISTHVEDVSEDELKRRMAEFEKKPA